MKTLLLLTTLLFAFQAHGNTAYFENHKGKVRAYDYERHGKTALIDNTCKTVVGKKVLFTDEALTQPAATICDALNLDIAELSADEIVNCRLASNELVTTIEAANANGVYAKDKHYQRALVQAERVFKKCSSAHLLTVKILTNAAGSTGGENCTYDLELSSFGNNKVGVIKALREFLGIGLLEAKNLSEAAPVIVLENASLEDVTVFNDGLIEKGGIPKIIENCQ